MKSSKQYILESNFDIHDLDYKKNYGISFRWAYTPKDQPGKFSLITPENESAWNEWKAVSGRDHARLRKHWNTNRENRTLGEFIAPHKLEQIKKHAK